MNRRSRDALDRAIAESAEREAVAQLDILRALKPLDRDGRKRVLLALGHILEAESLVPGIFYKASEMVPSKKGKSQ